MKRTRHSIRLGGYVGLIFLMGCDTIMTSTPPAGDDFESPFDGMGHDLNAAFV